jgi:hypothetical protein
MESLYSLLFDSLCISVSSYIAVFAIVTLVPVTLPKDTISSSLAEII